MAKPKKKLEIPPELLEALPKDPMDAVPAVADDLEILTDKDGLIQIRREVKKKRKVGKFFAEKLGFRRYLRVNFDERGSFFLRQIDGERPLRDIEKNMRKEFSLKPEESKKAVLLFTKNLMLRYLIYMKLLKKNLERRNSASDGT